MTFQTSDLGTILLAPSGIAAAMSAYFWIQSARVKLPDFSIIGAYSAQKDQIAPIGQWARVTATLSGKAAAWASAAALGGFLSAMLSFAHQVA